MILLSSRVRRRYQRHQGLRYSRGLPGWFGPGNCCGRFRESPYFDHAPQERGFFAIVGMALWTVLTGVNLIRSISGVASGIVPAITVLTSFVHFVAALSLLVFFGVFYRSQS